MKLKLLLLLNSFLFPITSFAVDDDIENLSKLKKEVDIRVGISNANLNILENERKRLEINDSLKKNKSVSIIAVSSGAVYVSKSGVIKKYVVGDSFEGSTIKLITDSGFVLSNGKKYDAL